MSDLSEIYENWQEVIDGALGSFDVYQLTAGTLNNSFEAEFYQVSYPVYFITNVSASSFNTTDLFYNLTIAAANLKPTEFNKNSFIGGVVTICFVLTGVVTASWMQLLLLLLDHSTIPKVLIITVLFYSIRHTEMLARFTFSLTEQYEKDYTDMEDLTLAITYSLKNTITRCVGVWLIFVSYVGIVAQISNYKHRKNIWIFGGILSLIDLAFALSYGIVGWNQKANVSEKTSFNVLRIMNYIFYLATIALYEAIIIGYSFKKRVFAYHSTALALAIFAWLTFICPFVFYAFSIACTDSKSWSIYIFTFSLVCVLTVSWEWIRTMKSLEMKHEKAAVLGRKISNADYFKNYADTEPPAPKTQFLKKLERIILMDKIQNSFHKFAKPRQSHDSRDTSFSHHEDQEVQLFGLTDIESPRVSSSTISEVSQLSYVLGENHPEFNIDHTYLRETPSTLEETSSTNNHEM